uniref:HATPase_c domain-containing protein n=1 Tax=Parastrongyloides trichosuri TaxID=131310 RepID=A0A0N4ZYA1_PARTI
MLAKKLSLLLIILQALLVPIYCSNDTTVSGNSTKEEIQEPPKELFEAPPKAAFSVEDIEKMTVNETKHEFQAEISRMMKLIINSLYKNKEIFMRELISNAADALDKIRFLSYKQKDALAATEDLLIRIKSDPEAQTVTLTDTGIGMTKEELITHLGTIAKSGTANFIEKIMNANNAEEQQNLIGQFGVGFYSVFLVADKVVVRSKHNNDSQYIWISDASGYVIHKDPEGDTLKRGTEVTLYLKEDAKKYSDLSTLRNLVHTYSQFITFDIYAYEKQRENEEKKEGDNSEEKDKKPAVKYAWEKINGFKPLWVRQASNVTDEEYEHFYNGLIINPFERKPSLGRIHFHTEGDVVFKGIFYIPGKLNEKMQDNVLSITKLVKLYVRRVFITDQISEILPRYLSWVAGVIDSDDLPLNVSREVLQQSKLLKLIKKKVVRKILEMINKLKGETFDKFYEIYSRKMKHGILEDHENANKIAKILRFNSSYGGNHTSLDDYISRMGEDQKEIYYLGGESIHEIQTSPLVENYIKKGVEVLFCLDPLDENVFEELRMYKDKTFRNLAISKSEDTSKEDEEQHKDYETEFAPLIDWFKKNIMDNRVEKVVVSKRLSVSPAAYIATERSISGYRAKLIRATQILSKSSADSILEKLRYIFEINPTHEIVKNLLKLIEEDENSPVALSIGHLISDTAKLRSGFVIERPDEFASRIEENIRKTIEFSDKKPILDEENVSMATESEVEKPVVTEEIVTKSTESKDKEESILTKAKTEKCDEDKCSADTPHTEL